MRCDYAVQTPRSASFAGALLASVVPCVGALDPHEWDALVSDNDFFNSHGWLASLDHALGDAEVLTVTGPSGLVAGCSLWRGEREQGLFCLPEFFPSVPGPWHEPFLWLGARRSTHNEIPCVRGYHRAQVLDALLSAALVHATHCGLAGVVMPYMPLWAAQELVEAHDGAVLLPHSAEAAIKVLPGGLDEEVARWNTHYRWRTKAELATFAKKGNQIEWTPLSEDIAPVAARLIAQNRARHGSMQGDEWMERMLAGQRKSGVLGSAIAAVAKRGNEAIAISVFYRFGQSLHVRYFGSNYAVNDNDFRYFVLTYYEPLNYAAARGLTQFRLSTSSLKAKASRGASIEPLAAVVMLAKGGLDNGSVARHNAAFVHRHQGEFASHLSPEWACLNP